MKEQAGRRPLPAKRAEKAVEIKGDPAFFRRINYPAVGAGFVVAMVVYVALGYLFTVPGAAFAQNTGVYVSIGCLAMYCGGLTAGMIEPKYGVLNGPIVAVLFILVTYLLTFNSELQRVRENIHVDLGPMRVDRVFLTDVPQLFFASLGGWTAGMIEQRLGRRARRGNGKKPAG